MVADLTFPNTTSFETADDDPLRIKWNIARPFLNFSPLPVTPLDLVSIGLLNETVNHEIKYLEEPPGVDRWQTPVFTWQVKSGDCEDYALLKYATLLKSGLPKENLRLVIGEIKSLSVPDGRIPHAWLAVYLPQRISATPLLTTGVWHVLDNKFDELFAPASDYPNWRPEVSCSGLSVLRYGEQFSINDKLKELA